MVGNRSNLAKIFIIVLLIPAFAKTTTIYDVQFNDSLQGSGDDCYPSPLKGQSVILSGIVTAVKSGAYKNFFLQDRTEGLWNGIYFYENTVQPSRGDSLTVTATVDEYYGMTEMKDVTSYTIHSHNLSLPPPVEISTGTLAVGCSAVGEAYEGVLVRVGNVVVTKEPNAYGEWYVDDGTGECQVEDELFAYSPSLGDSIKQLTGVVTYGYGEYEINPRDMNDIIPEGVNLSPLISEVSHSSDFASPTETVFITAEIVDEDGTIEADSLFYTLNDTIEWISLPHDSVVNSTYHYHIPPQAGGVVYYYIWAKDNSDSTSKSPNNFYVITRDDGTIPIIAIHKNNPDGTPLLIDEWVKITGVVTVSDQFNGQSYIQDGTGGVCVYGISNLIEIGDSSVVSGKITLWYGLAELSPCNLLDAPIPTEHVVEPKTIVCIDLGEKFEGELVRIDRVTSGENTFPFDGNITIEDETGECEVRIDKDTDLPGNPIPDSFSIIGVVSQYDLDIPYTEGYQLMPRFLKDIRNVGSGSGVTEIDPNCVLKNREFDIKLSISGESDTINGVQITIPTQFIWDISDCVLEGDGFESATYSTPTPSTVLITGASVTKEDTGYFLSKFISPDSTGKFSFGIETKVKDDSLKQIIDLPGVWVTEPISNVQAVGFDGYSSSMEGSEVMVKGVVTGPSSIFSGEYSTSFYIQDETGGVNVYSSEDEANPRYTIGKLVVAKGIVTEYNGLTEVKYGESRDVLVFESTSPPEPETLLLSQSIVENLEGKLVCIPKAKVATTPSIAGEGKNFQVWNGLSLIDVRVENKTGIDLSAIEVGDYYDLTGICGQYDDSSPHNSGYQLLLRFPDDINQSDLGDISKFPKISFSVNPFSPDRGEVMQIFINIDQSSKCTLKIFDLEGRLVKTIAETYPGGFAIFEWRGKNERNAKVPVGIYLLYFETIDKNGKSARQIKPLIIGTK